MDRSWDSRLLGFWEEHWTDSRDDLQAMRILSADRDFRRLWASGAMQWTREYGLEPNVAAYALLNQSAAVNYRLWRSQVQFLMTLANRLRLLACKKLQNVYGANWPIRFQTQIGADDWPGVCAQPSTCELGALVRVLKSYDHKMPHNWSGLIDRAHTVRNTVAHYKTVSYATFDSLWRHYRKTVLD